MTEVTEAGGVTPELLRSMFRETHGLIEQVRAEAAFRHADTIRSQHTIIDQLEKLNARVDRHDARFDALETRFDRLEAKVDRHDVRFEALETRFDGLETRFDGLETRFDGLDGRVGRLEDGQQEMLVLQRDLAERQQQLLRHQGYTDARIDALDARLGGEPVGDSRGGLTRAEMTVVEGQLRAVDSSVGSLSVRVESRMDDLHDDVRAIAVAVGARPAATEEGGG